MSEFYSLWDAASVDVEAENRLRASTAASLAAEPLWTFLALAQSSEELGHRLALVEDRIETIAADNGVDSEEIVEEFTRRHGLLMQVRAGFPFPKSDNEPGDEGTDSSEEDTDDDTGADQDDDTDSDDDDSGTPNGGEPVDKSDGDSADEDSDNDDHGDLSDADESSDNDKDDDGVDDDDDSDAGQGNNDNGEQDDSAGNHENPFAKGSSKTAGAMDDYKADLKDESASAVEEAHQDGNHSWCSPSRGCRSIPVKGSKTAFEQCPSCKGSGEKRDKVDHMVESCPSCEGRGHKLAINDAEMSQASNEYHQTMYPEDDAEGDEGHEGQCPACGGPSTLLGQLGRRVHYRCRNCGMDHSREPDFGNDSEGDDSHDDYYDDERSNREHEMDPYGKHEDAMWRLHNSMLREIQTGNLRDILGSRLPAGVGSAHAPLDDASRPDPRDSNVGRGVSDLPAQPGRQVRASRSEWSEDGCTQGDLGGSKRSSSGSDGRAPSLPSAAVRAAGASGAPGTRGTQDGSHRARRSLQQPEDTLPARSSVLRGEPDLDAWAEAWVSSLSPRVGSSASGAVSSTLPFVSAEQTGSSAPTAPPAAPSTTDAGTAEQPTTTTETSTPSGMSEDADVEGDDEQFPFGDDEESGGTPTGDESRPRTSKPRQQPEGGGGGGDNPFADEDEEGEATEGEDSGEETDADFDPKVSHHLARLRVMAEMSGLQYGEADVANGPLTTKFLDRADQVLKGTPKGRDEHGRPTPGLPGVVDTVKQHLNETDPDGPSLRNRLVDHFKQHLRPQGPRGPQTPEVADPLDDEPPYPNYTYAPDISRYDTHFGSVVAEMSGLDYGQAIEKQPEGEAKQNGHTEPKMPGMPEGLSGAGEAGGAAEGAGAGAAAGELGELALLAL